MELLVLKKNAFAWLALSVLCLVSACAGIIQKGGEILEGNAFAEKTSAVYISADGADRAALELKEIALPGGESAVEITSAEWPGLILRGTSPSGRSGNFEFTEVRFLSAHVNGWNEFTIDVLGSAIFWTPAENTGSLHIQGGIERVQISSGMIRLKGSRITGADALTLLRNRRERILALIEWMRGNEVFTNIPRFADRNEFESYWKPRLFPELAAKNARPAAYSEENAQWRVTDGVSWNSRYTEFIFGEELWELRNSGALLRDWEEALPWIYLEYSWNSVIASFSETILHKVN